MNQPNSNILLSLIQGDAGKQWAASKNGWKEKNQDGECCETHPNSLQLNQSIHSQISHLFHDNINININGDNIT
jgi:hypothetical protein